MTSFVPSGKCRLDLNVVDHLGDALHHLMGGDHVRAGLHEIGHRPSIAGALHHRVGNQGDRFWVIEFHPPLETSTRHHGCHCNKKLVFFTRCQIHDPSSA